MDVDLYARISDDQADDAHGTTTQIAECTAYASERGWTVVDTYRDDSVSATKGKQRPGFEALLSRPVKRPVLVWHVDRLVRVSADLERVITQDLTVHALHAGLLDLSTATGRAVARTVTAWSTYEGEIKAQRQIAANRALATAGEPLWRVAPYGHTTAGELVPEEAAVLREAAERVLRGESVRSVRMWLLTVPGAPRTNVNRLLINPRLAGHNIYRGERMPASNIVPILDEDTFYELTGLLTDPTRRTSGSSKGRVTTLLTAIARCGMCDDGTGFYSGVDKGVKVYKCASKKHSNQHPQESVDGIVMFRTLELLQRPDADKVIERHATTPESVKEEMRDLRSQLEDWQAVAGELGAVEYVKVTKPLRTRLAELEEAARSTSHRDLFEGLVRPDGFLALQEDLEYAFGYMQRWRSLPLLKRREIVSTLWNVTLNQRDRPRGPASKTDQPHTVVMTER